MKKINFTKMVGAGNDFIIIDFPKKGIDVKKLTIRMCDRTNGVGADGLLILDKSKKADYMMRIINADGSEAEMCGNGARCMATYIVKNYNPDKKIFSMETLAGIIMAQAKEETAQVTLSDPKNYLSDIPLTINNATINVSYIDTGVPHAIVYIQGLDKINVHNIGRTIRYHQRFQPRGTNVNFVEILGRDIVDCRTYERGVEDETKACGTGSVAAAIVTYLRQNPEEKNKKKAKMKVKTKSGETLEVYFDMTDQHIHHVQLKGSAKFIARGEYYT